MKKERNTISFENAVNIANVDNVILKRRSYGLLISDYQIDILKRNNIDFLNYNSLDELLFDIEELLNDDYDDELDLISSQLSEYKYYKDTKK